MANQEVNAYFADEFSGRIDMHQVIDHMQMGANIREQDELEAIYRITDREEGIKALAIHYALMVEEGSAWAYRRYLKACNSSAYIEAEDSAQQKGRGLWAGGKPVAPWDYRRSKRG